MGATTLSFVIDGEPDPQAAFDKMIADAEAKLAEQAERYPDEQVDRWWLHERHGKQRAFTVVNHPHLSVAQCEQGSIWPLLPADYDKWGPWLAVPVGPTSVLPQALSWHGGVKPFAHLRNDGDPIIRYAWGQLESLAVVVSAETAVTFLVEVHTPVGEPTGWCFFGWVNT